MEELKSALLRHDWWYIYSDDSVKFNAGKEEKSEIVRLITLHHMAKGHILVGEDVSYTSISDVVRGIAGKPKTARVASFLDSVGAGRLVKEIIAK